MERRDFLKNFLRLACFSSYRMDLFEETKEIYLTVDDGPLKSTENILTNLRKDDKVTFFMVGERMNSQKGFDVACKVLDLGHEVGNHSYSHPEFSKISREKIREEIEKMHELIEHAYKINGRINPLLFRFPYGDSGGNKKIEIKKFLNDMGYTDCRWTLDSEDWRYYAKEDKKNIEDILINVGHTKNHAIVLTHNLPITAQQIIPFYTSGNYNLVTLKRKKVQEMFS